MGWFEDITGVDSGVDVDTSNWGVGDISLDPDRIRDDIEQAWEEGWDDLGDFIREDLLGIEIPETPEQPEGVLLTKQGNTQPIPVAYGARRLGGQRVFVETTGTTNEYLHLVIALCEGEINSIGSLWINDVEVPVGSIDGSGNVTAGVYSGLLRIKKYLGTDAQTADADLVSEVTNWTTDHRLRGVAYVYLRCQWNQDNRAFGSFPKVQVDIEGRKVYDSRTTTTAYSNNPALCLYDYLTNSRYGRGLDAADIDTQSFEDGADYCDDLVTPYSGAPGTHARYACDGMVNTGRKLLDNTKGLLRSCRGWLPYVSGQWRLVLDKPETAAFIFDTSNIIGALSFARAGRRGRLNRVQASYANPDENYASDLVVVDSSAFRTADNNLLLERRISLPYTANVYRAEALAELQLKQSRQGLTVNFRATLAALKVAVGEVVNVTHATPGWTNKLFRVATIGLPSSATVPVTLIEYEATVYNLTLPTEAPTQPDTNLPDPNVVAAPTGLGLVNIGQELTAFDGTLTVRIKVTWTPPADIFVDAYDVEYKKSVDSNWIPAANPIGQATAETFIYNVQDNTNYDVRVRSRNTNGAVSAWLLGVNHPVLPKASTIAVDYSNVSGTKPPANADVTGDNISTGSGVLFNWALDVIDSDGKPAGIRSISGSPFRDGITFGDVNKNFLRLDDPVELQLTAGFPAVPIDDKQKYKITVRHRANAVSSTGLYLRMEELNTVLPQGKTHIGSGGETAVVTARSSVVSLLSNGALPGASWVDTTYTYTPTAGSRFATFSMYKWNIAASFTYDVDSVSVEPLNILQEGTTISGGGIIMSAGGVIKSIGKVIGAGVGFFLGYSGGKYQLDIGDHDLEKFIQFDGTDVDVGINTRIKGVSSYNNDSVYIHEVFPSLDSWASIVSGGSSSVAVDVGGFARLVAGVSAFYSARMYRWWRYPLTPWTWAAKRRFKVSLVSVNASPGCIIEFGLGTGVGNLLRFRIEETAAYAYTGETGVGTTKTSLSTTISAYTSYVYEIIFDNTVPNAKFYIDGSLKATITTNVPDGTSDTNSDQIEFKVDQGASPTVPAEIYVSEFKFIQE